MHPDTIAQTFDLRPIIAMSQQCCGPWAVVRVVLLSVTYAGWRPDGPQITLFLGVVVSNVMTSDMHMYLPRLLNNRTHWVMPELKLTFYTPNKSN